jgi:hypothetical protein
MKLILFTLLTLSCTASAVPKGEVVTPSPKPFIVNESTLQLIGNVDFISAGKELDKLERAAPGARFNILIDGFSNQHNVEFILRFMKAMEDKNTNCYIKDIVNGFAFSLFQACTVRTVGSKAALAISQIAMTGTFNRGQLVQAIKKMDALAKQTTMKDAKRMGFTDHQYYEYLGAEPKLISAWEAKRINAVDFISDGIECQDKEAFFQKGFVDSSENGVTVEISECPIGRVIKTRASLKDAKEAAADFGLIVEGVISPEAI